jgi:hypothetical protein
MCERHLCALARRMRPSSFRVCSPLKPSVSADVAMRVSSLEEALRILASSEIVTELDLSELYEHGKFVCEYVCLDVVT